MPETILVSPEVVYDDEGNPIAPTGSAVALPTLGVAPGNTEQILRPDGTVEVADYTVYLPLRTVQSGTGYVDTQTLIPDDAVVTVRDKACRARVQRWDQAGRGGLVVLCQSRTGGA